MIFGTFGCLLYMRIKNHFLEKIDDLAGISESHPLLAAGLAIFMFSFAGIPPLAGFFGKFYILSAIIESGHYYLAIIGVLTSVIAAYYYLRVVKVMYFDSTDGDKQVFVPSIHQGKQGAIRVEGRLVLALAAMVILFFTFYPIFILDKASSAATSLMFGW